MPEDYKDISLNRDKIEEAILSYELNITFKKSEFKNGTHVKYLITTADGNIVTLNIYFKLKGKTSFSFNEGGNQELGIKIANHVIENTKFDDSKDGSLYIKSFSTENYKDLIDYLIDCGAKEVSTKVLPNGIKSEFESRFGDKVHLNKFNNGAFNVQGQYGLLKSQVIEGLSNYLSYDEVVELTYKSLEIKELDKQSTEKLFENRLPLTNGIINQHVKLLMLPSFLFQHIKLDTTDYSYMAFPIFRGLEGFIKQLFLTNGIVVTNNFGSFLEINVTGKFVLTANCESQISSIYVKRVIEKLYNYYKTNRHPIFHVDGTIISTRLVGDFKTGNSIINETCEIIEKCSACIVESDLKKLL